jgi:hypothetical protein
MRKIPAPTAQKAEPKPAAKDQSQDQLAGIGIAIISAVRAQGDVASAIRDAMKELAKASQKPSRLEAIVERDQQGRMTGIIVKPVYED